MRKKRPDRKHGEYTEEEMRIIAPKGTAIVEGIEKLKSIVKTDTRSTRSGQFVFNRSPKLPPGRNVFNLRDQRTLVLPQ